LSAITIPTGKYKCYQAKSASPADIVAVWQTIWATSPEELNRSFIADFEVYNEHEAMIYIGYK